MAAIAIGLTALAVLGIATPPGIDVAGVGIAPLLLALGYVAALAWFRRVPPIGVATPTPTPFREPQRWGERWAGTGPQAKRFLCAAAVLTRSPHQDRPGRRPRDRDDPNGE